MSRFQRAVDPDRAGQMLLRDGAPVGLLFWGARLRRPGRDGVVPRPPRRGRGGGRGAPRRLEVLRDVGALAADRTLERAAWLARADTLELVTAAAALAAAEAALTDALG